MTPVGRKRYIAIDENTVIGIEVLSMNPEKLGIAADPKCEGRLLDIIDLDGERIEVENNPPVNTGYGKDINSIIETKECWIPKGHSNG